MPNSNHPGGRGKCVKEDEGLKSPKTASKHNRSKSRSRQTDPNEQNSNVNSTATTSPRVKVRKTNKKLKETSMYPSCSDNVDQADLQSVLVEQISPDQIAVSIHAAEENEFNTDQEENADSDNESLHEETDSMAFERVVTPIQGQSPIIDDNDSEVVSFNRQKHSQTEMELDFDKLAANLAFHSYVEKLVAKQVRQSGL